MEKRLLKDKLIEELLSSLSTNHTYTYCLRSWRQEVATQFVPLSQVEPLFPKPKDSSFFLGPIPKFHNLCSSSSQLPPH